MTPEEQEAFDKLQGDLHTLQAESAAGAKLLGERGATIMKAEQSASRLARDHRVWAMAFSDCTAVRTAGPAESEAPAQHVERLARAALTDSIALVSDGKTNGLEALVVLQMRAVIGDPEVATVLGRLEQLRQQDSDTAAPTGVVARSRKAVRTLTELTQNLPDGEARKLISSVLNAQVAPDESAADKLFRVLTTSTHINTDDALAAHGAVSEIRAAFLAMAPPSP